jgi:hypothetical protein
MLHMHAELGSSPVQEMGIAAADIKKLREASYHVIEAVAHATKRELLLVKGLSEAKVNKIKEAGRRPFTPCPQECWLTDELLAVFCAGPGCHECSADCDVGCRLCVLQLERTATWAS